MRFWPTGIRTRLLAALVLTVTLALAGSATATAWALNSYLKERVSGRLENVGQRIQEVVAMNVANHGGMQITERPFDTLLGDADGLILVVDGQPGMLVRIPAGSAPGLIDATARAPRRVVFVNDGNPAATIGIPVQGLSVVLNDTAEPVQVDSIVLSVSRADDRQTVARLIRIAVLAGLVALALSGALAAVVVRAGLRPLTNLAEAVVAVGKGERGPEAVPLHGSTETAQVALAVRDAFTARARAESRLRSFVADASHELRTPLTKISGWVDLYLQGAVRGEEGTRAALEKVEAEVGRMGLLVEELSLLARLDAQVPLDRVELGTVEVVALIDEVLEDARVVAPDRGFTQHRPPGDEPGVVLADAERLRRVLRNLVGNAVQHTPAGTPVEVSLFQESDTLVIAVRDHGEGIPAEQLPMLFERFWRAEESRTRARGGSGLGLAIVEAVVVAHGGTVNVQSETRPGPDRGTTVTIRLPRTHRTDG